MIFVVAPKPQSLVVIGICFFPSMALTQIIYYEFLNFWVLLCLMWHIFKQCFDHQKLCAALRWHQGICLLQKFVCVYS
jgi:hypothetical protein